MGGCEPMMHGHPHGQDSMYVDQPMQMHGHPHGQFYMSTSPCRCMAIRMASSPCRPAHADAWPSAWPALHVDQPRCAASQPVLIRRCCMTKPTMPPCAWRPLFPPEIRIAQCILCPCAWYSLAFPSWEICRHGPALIGCRQWVVRGPSPPIGL